MARGATPGIQTAENGLEDPRFAQEDRALTVFYVNITKGWITATFSVKMFKVLRLRQSLGTKQTPKSYLQGNKTLASVFSAAWNSKRQRGVGAKYVELEVRRVVTYKFVTLLWHCV